MSKVGQEQIHGLLFSDRLSWQAIIYDLINTEQLDPWDIDISLLAQKFLEKVRALEEANFFISSKVLLAASLLLRMKTEILLEQDLQTIDNILFGKKEKKEETQKEFEFDEETIPKLVVKTPLPRYKKVTLEELMRALGKAINTENRRIKRVILTKQHEFETAIALPKHSINLHDSMRDVHNRLKEIFKNRKEKIAFSEFAGKTPQEKISAFIPLLHLDTQHKVWLEQEGHCQEIWILLKQLYEQQKALKKEESYQELEENFEETPEEEFYEQDYEEEDEEENYNFKAPKNIEDLSEEE